MPAIAGILETCLYVQDLARARAFYETVLPHSPMFEDERLVAYDAGPASVLILFRKGATLEPIALPGGTIPPHDATGPAHIAFAVPEDSIAAWRETFDANGIVVESEVSWPAGGTSLYVRDPDGHAVEFATPGLWQNYPRGLRAAP